MNSNRQLSRRQFLQASVAGLSFMYLPGIGRVQARPFSMKDLGGDFGRLCYNENPLGPSPLALEAIHQTASRANRYPDWFSTNLEGLIAQQHGVPSSWICAGAGATEIIHLVAEAFLGPGDELITATPTYSQMANEAVANGASVVFVPVDDNHFIDIAEIYNAITPQTKLVSLVNANNPLGNCINRTDMETFLHSLPGGIIVVVDEAYHQYIHSPDYESCIRYVQNGDPVIVIRTFSKVYGLAGARIGYSIASSMYTGPIASGQNIGMVSTTSQAAAEAALNDQEHVDNTVNLNDQAMELLTNGLTNLGLTYIPSQTNFLMFDTGTYASNIASELASAGFQVRVGWDMPNHIRVSTGTLDEMTGFIAALDDIYSRTPGTGTPTMFALNSISPDPFTSRCTITFTTFGNEKTFLSVYDITGRKVITLINAVLGTGTHTVVWDGRDVMGRQAAAGIYIANLMQGEFGASKRITLIR
jgi:histidinol-phosphate aminotransferase